MKFHFATIDYHLDDDENRSEGNTIMQGVGSRPVNDLVLYHFLCSEEGCVRVDICAVRCIHGCFVNGFQVVYRSLFKDKTTKETEARLHDMRGGYFSSVIHGQISTSTFLVEPGEYIEDIYTRNGDVVDAIQLVTNRRRVYFGGYGGRGCSHWLSSGNEGVFRSYDCEIIDCPKNTIQRIVALSATTSNGAIHRIGYYTKSIAWETIGSLILLRKLVDNNRALVVESNSHVREQLMLQRLITEPLEDVFREVSSFLVRQRI